MSKFSIAMKRFGGFLKRNAFYFLIVLCIASVATVIALAVTRNTSTQAPDMSIDDNQTVLPEDPNGGNAPGGETPGDDEPGDLPDTPKQLTFNMPCNGTVTVEFAYDELVFSSTLDQWAVHTGVDFVSDDLNVYAAADGKITEAGYDELNGYYIAIEHDEGYVTKYKSLDGLGAFKVGDKVEQGKLLGKMSDSQGEEMNDGAHLHFEMYKDGEYVDPLDKLVMNEK